MEDEDYNMGEDTIMASTEPNGDVAADNVSSSENMSNLRSPLAPRREQLPFHSPSRPTSLLQPNFGHTTSHQTTASPRSDRLSLAQSQPVRRPSPQIRIPPPPRSMVLPYATSRTGLVYDPRMRFHAELPEQSTNGDDIHPEDPRRIHSIFEEIKQAGLVDASTSKGDVNEDQCWRIGIRYATRPEILLVHTQEHYDFVESLQGESKACQPEYD